MASRRVQFLTGLGLGLSLSSAFGVLGLAQDGLRRVTVIPTGQGPSPSPAPAPQTLQTAPTAQARPIQRPTQPLVSATEDPAAELLAEQARVKAAYQQLNQTNPMSVDQKLPEDLQRQMAALIDPKVMAQIEQAKRLLEDPMIKRYLEVLSNEEFQESARAIMQHPNRKNFLYTQLALFVIWLFVRSYQLGRAQTFFKRLGVSLVSLVAYVLISGVIVPVLFFGPVYLKFLNHFVRLFQVIF